MDKSETIEQFKIIISFLLTTTKYKEEIESLLNKYSNDNEKSLPIIIEEIHRLMIRNDANMTKQSLQSLLDDIFNELDVFPCQTMRPISGKLMTKYVQSYP